MTRFTVVWVHSILDELAELWLNSHDRDSVTEAVASIDADLSEDAFLKGTHLNEGLRELAIPPLRVLFTVRGDDRMVEVVRVTEILKP